MCLGFVFGIEKALPCFFPAPRIKIKLLYVGSLESPTEFQEGLSRLFIVWWVRGTHLRNCIGAIFVFSVTLSYQGSAK